MAINPASKILRHLHRTAFLGDGSGLTDGQLLERYLRHREDAAFAALVRRHGPMVMGVCRRALGNVHDAEDAFQATFLVLVRKAAAVIPRERVANFLYGVAHTTALRAKGLIAKRRARERQMAELPEPQARQPDEWKDLRPVLDLELSRLPDKYRVPIVLCDLEDRSIKEAARHLGWPQGTLAGRLARARVMLAKRIARRGLVVSGGSLAALLSQEARPAGMPTRLISGTIEAARLFAAGQAASGLIAAPVVALTEGVLRAMLVTKLKTATAVLAAAILVLSAAGGVYKAIAGDAPTEKQPATPPAALDVPQAKTQAKASEQDAFKPASSEHHGKYELSTGPMPRQALVSLKNDLLLLRTLEVTYEPITMRSQGKQDQTFTTYQSVELLKTRPCPLDWVKAYDMRGQRIDTEQLPKLLQKEIVALVSDSELAADPLNLRLFKEGTLLFITPLPVAPGAVSVSTNPSPLPPPPVPVSAGTEAQRQEVRLGRKPEDYNAIFNTVLEVIGRSLRGHPRQPIRWPHRNRIPS
jgi:RNA polymerase sigma factor (sigma-70 family)